MAAIESVFSLTRADGNRIISFSNNYHGEVPFTHIGIYPNNDGSGISRADCLYRYQPTNNSSITEDYRQSIDGELINSVLMIEGPHLLGKIMSILNVTNEYRKNELDKFIVPLFGERKTERDERITYFFLISLVSSIFYYRIMIEHGKLKRDMGKPFGALSLVLPSNLNSENDTITFNFYAFISYYSKTLVSLDMKVIGRYWMEEIDAFWVMFGAFFNRGPEYHNAISMFNSMNSMSNQISVLGQSMTETASKTFTDIFDSLKLVYRIRDTLLSSIESRENEFIQRMNQMTAVNIATSIASIDAVRKETTKALKEINRNKGLTKDFDKFRNATESHATAMVKKLSEKSNDIINDSHGEISETVLDLKRKADEIGNHIAVKLKDLHEKTDKREKLIVERERDLAKSLEKLIVKQDHIEKRLSSTDSTALGQKLDTDHVTNKIFREVEDRLQERMETMIEEYTPHIARNVRKYESGEK